VGAKPVVLADVGLDDARGEGAAAIGVRGELVAAERA